MDRPFGTLFNSGKAGASFIRDFLSPVLAFECLLMNLPNLKNVK